MSLEGASESIMMQGMVIDMNDAKLRTLDQVRAFLQGTVALDLCLRAEERYEFVARTVRRFGYARLSRADKGLVLRFLMHVSGYSRQRMTRLVARAQQPVALVKRYRASRTSFGRTYSQADVRLLAHTDSLHGTLSGPATKKLMERAYRVFGDERYQRLATISVGHLYNLRKRAGYGRVRHLRTKTRTAHIAIGQRRAPAPDNRPGFLRVDSVHQGDQDGLKGLYHINAVDCASPSTKPSPPASRSAKRFCCRCSKRCCKASRSTSSDSTSITARSTSITASPSCSTSCSSSSSPSHAHVIATTTPWSSRRTAPSFANTSAIATSPSGTPASSTHTAPSTSTLT